jgi:hypothetical protein
VGIKEQIDFAKDELTQDEKLLAGLIKAERFYKRNKTLILGIAGVVVAGALGYAAMDYMENRRLMAANEALLQWQANPDDIQALQKLREKNPKLAALVALNAAVRKQDAQALAELASQKDPLVSDLAKYHAAALKSDRKALENYALQSGALLKEMAIFDDAYLLLASGEIEKGKARLAEIPENSPLHDFVTMLEHYGGARKVER